MVQPSRYDVASAFSYGRASSHMMGLVNASDRTRRVMLWELDSVECRRIYDDSATSCAAERHIVGAIRTAMLVSDCILVTASMLFDSYFFSTVGPHELSIRLGVEIDRLPFIFLAKDSFLSEAKDRGCDPAEAGTYALREELKERLYRRAFRWQLARGEGDLCPSPGSVASWEAWLGAVDHGCLAVESLDGAGKGVMRMNNPWATEPYGVQLSGSTEFQEFIRAGRAPFVAGDQYGKFERSPLDNAYSQVLSNASEEEKAAARDLRYLWNAEYLTAIALQQHADWIRVAAPPGNVDPGTGRLRSLSVASTMVSTVPDVTSSIFGLVMEKTVTARRAYCAKRSRPRQWMLAYQVARVVEVPSVVKSLFFAILRISLAVVAAVAARGTFAGAPHVVTLLIGLIVFLATIPVSDIATIWSITPWKTRGALEIRTSRD